jgi:DNA mismatch endonuclease (patch repair protein)
MVDTVTKSARSKIMAAVKSRDTGPEMIVRRELHRLGYRFRLHRRDLPGTPDVVLPGLRKIINVHGCFWHMHSCQRRRKPPVNHAEYWEAKRLGNARRDRRNLRKLVRQGWEVLVVWECQTKNAATLSGRLKAFLDCPPTASMRQTDCSRS